MSKLEDIINPQSEPSTRVELDLATMNPQPTSPLFNLPGEIRNQIWEYALTPYNDPNPERRYSSATAYSRPDYISPLTTSVSLLRVCKAIYSEAWYLPWRTAELGFYLTSSDRHPPKIDTIEKVSLILEEMVKKGIDTTTNRVRVFAQLYALEDGQRLQGILGTKHFFPREVVVTIRHTDFWFWENDENLKVGGRWVAACRFPQSVKRVKVEFESLERKKGQIDEIAQQAVEHWEFRRVDGARFSAVLGGGARDDKEGKGKGKEVEGEMEVMRWTGDSSFQGMRWRRDEVEEGKLNYYVKTVIWRIKHELSEDGDTDGPGQARDIWATHVPQLPFDAERLDCDEDDCSWDGRFFGEDDEDYDDYDSEYAHDSELELASEAQEWEPQSERAGEESAVGEAGGDHS
ncbi:hypothetical protein TWF481_006551 [Arthrobotrys musiformis]|uniref:Uncharacterized protein n=1 Tax=Arthrobotrys musiformis TaxID=47236 RepID=A0AAV9W8Y4_9PEZI